jgi:uncharacterized phosphosugar-binding protein
LLGEVQDDDREIRRAADLIVAAVAAGGLVHVFGTGHSHLLAEELFLRAGGLAQVNPILLDAHMLNAGAAQSTRLERLSRLASALFDGEPVTPPDVLIVVSNSGRNVAGIEIAVEARLRGIRTIALTSVRHAATVDARHAGGPRLHEVVDVVLDNRGRLGDACVTVAGFEQPVAATSTVMGAALLNAVVAEAVEILVIHGHRPDVFASSNIAGGDRINSELVARYSPRVRAL